MNTRIFSMAGFILFVALLLGCQQQPAAENTPAKKGLIKVTILYPNGAGKKFDMDYYARNHMPLVASLLGDSLKFFEIDKGIRGRTPADSIPYLAIGYLYFDRLSAYENSFRPHADSIVKDIANYTNIQPIVQISEVLR